MRAGTPILVKRAKDPFENMMKVIDTNQRREIYPIIKHKNLLSILGGHRPLGVKRAKNYMGDGGPNI